MWFYYNLFPGINWFILTLRRYMYIKYRKNVKQDMIETIIATLLLRTNAPIIFTVHHLKYFFNFTHYLKYSTDN